ncbi:unnamed protein product [Caenorhabditis bovis]|uniref:alpha-1,6-mannosyl-glycoprotein 6-beta-N-acetylglucosaminyltransferase n=1 Tax=Caenorhabditis bovis TaxID=2654633 RepID=A0A8S1F9A6_9PELO|nr:unnamed protein product [Caenorhabditis bovis]
MQIRLRVLLLIVIVTLSITPFCLIFYSVSITTANERTNRVPLEKYAADCEVLPDTVNITFPLCLNKIEWFKSGNWRKEPCYSQHKVDGSLCSFRRYLSEFESFCPPIGNGRDETRYAQQSSNIDHLFSAMHGFPESYAYIQILVFIGFLAHERTLKFAKYSKKGGPLGELLQWSDLIASLHILGHNVTVATSVKALRTEMSLIENSNECDASVINFDLIFTDIMGFHIFRKRKKQYTSNNRCRFRLIDSFGTHVEFSTPQFFQKFAQPIVETRKNQWGNLELNLRQHWTFYPHTSDNTFLGFVVDTSEIDVNITKSSKKFKALIYGKEKYMWENAETAIRVLSEENVDIHATVVDVEHDQTELMFENVTNHGFLDSRAISKLLDDVHLFFGLGFPLEGPAPLEAIAHGAIFINAHFDVAKNRINYKFLGEKPTFRQYTSQCPYMEEIGLPYVITTNINDPYALRKAIRHAKTLKPKPYVPEEFTTQGMLLRVGVFVEKQDFCSNLVANWPPHESLKIVTGGPLESCESACSREHLVCEPAHFPLINNKNTLKRVFPKCDSSSPNDRSPVAPYDCVLQKEPQLFSCASAPRIGTISRICPCRDKHHNHSAFCSKCI